METYETHTDRTKYPIVDALEIGNRRNNTFHNNKSDRPLTNSQKQAEETGINEYGANPIQQPPPKNYECKIRSGYH